MLRWLSTIGRRRRGAVTAEQDPDSTFSSSGIARPGGQVPQLAPAARCSASNSFCDTFAALPVLAPNVGAGMSSAGRGEPLRLALVEQRE